MPSHWLFRNIDVSGTGTKAKGFEPPGMPQVDESDPYMEDADRARLKLLQRQKEDRLQAQADLLADAYVKNVFRQIDKLMKYNYTGLAVLNHLNSAAGRCGSVQIKPFLQWEQLKFNGMSDPSHVPTPWTDASKSCNAEATPAATSPMLPSCSVTRQGNEVNVEYSPDAFERGSVCNSMAQQFGVVSWSEPDEFLLHELVHALRFVTGRFDGAHPFFNRDNMFLYDNIEEFLAILIANTYRSEQGRNGLVSFEHMLVDWRPPERLPWAKAYGDRFLGAVVNCKKPSATRIENLNVPHVRALAILYRQESALFHDIAMAGGIFNPIKFYIMHRPIYDRAVGMG
jgi:hypothetical protein